MTNTGEALRACLLSYNGSILHWVFTHFYSCTVEVLMKRCFIIVLLSLLGALAAGYAQSKPAIAILPFTGGQGEDGETIAELFSFEPALTAAFAPIPRTSINRAIRNEQNFQMGSGMTDPDTIIAIGKQLGARYTVAGNITALGSQKLLIISIINIEKLQQIAGDYLPYGQIEEIRSRLPAMARNIANAAKIDTSKLPKLAVVPFQLKTSTNAGDADALAQILAIYIIRIGKYAVYPRTASLEQVQAEYAHQMTGDTADEQVSRVGAGDNPQLVLSGAARRLGSGNMFNALILNLASGIQEQGASENYESLNDGITAMKNLANSLTGGGIASQETQPIAAQTVVMREPDWVRQRRVLPNDMVYFIGRSEPQNNYESYREAKGSALMDALTQFMLYQKAEVASIFTDIMTTTRNGTTNSQESTSRVQFAGTIAGLYQQGEWIAGDGTLYVLYASALKSGTNPRPDLPAFFQNQRLWDGELYFIGRAVSQDSHQGTLSAQAAEDAKLQAFLWLGGNLTGVFSDYTKSNNDNIISDAFKAAVKFTSRINTQNLSCYEEARHIQKEQDQKYHYYGLYSIRAGRGDTGAEREYFSYALEYSESSGRKSFAKQIAVNSSRFTRNQPYTPPRQVSSSNKVPAWINELPSEDCLWGIGTGQNTSIDAMNLMSAIRAVVSLASQVDQSIQTMITDYSSPETNLSPETNSSKGTSHVIVSKVIKNAHTLTGDNTLWQRWEVLKTNAREWQMVK
jgi:hypothetical protein